MKNFGGGGIGGPAKPVTNQVKGEIPQGNLPEVKTAGMDDNYVP